MQTDKLIQSIQEFDETKKSFIAELQRHRQQVEDLLQKFGENGNSRKNACSACGSQEHTARFHKKEK